MASILVVEDNKPIRSMIRQLLERADFQVDVAAHGAGAVSLIRQRRYAALVLDLVLPQDGWSILDTLENERIPVPVIAISASADLDCLKPRVFSTLAKPFPIHALLPEVQRAVEQVTGTIYRIDADDRIVLADGAWLGFARRNEAHGLTPEGGCRPVLVAAHLGRRSPGAVPPAF